MQKAQLQLKYFILESSSSSHVGFSEDQTDRNRVVRASGLASVTLSLLCQVVSVREEKPAVCEQSPAEDGQHKAWRRRQPLGRLQEAPHREEMTSLAPCTPRPSLGPAPPDAASATVKELHRNNPEDK